MAVNGFALAGLAAGTLFVYSGIKGKNITQAVQAVIQGKPPSAAGSSAAPPLAGTAASETDVGSAKSGAATATAGILTPAQLQALWVQAGGDPAQAQNAACHAMQESSGNPGATSGNPDGGTNVGLWQLDTPGGKGAGYSVSQLQNPLLNAQLTVLGTGNGTDWSAWATPGC